MHGRIKVKTTEEQKLEKQKEQQKKLAAYRAGLQTILSTRKKDSYSETSFKISGQLLCVNPDIYTLWNYRKEVVLLIKANDTPEDNEKLVDVYENELRLTEQCLLENPKSYGSWHHRYWILNQHPEPNWQKEFDHCNRYLLKDGRNFHVWDYRRLIVEKIGITIPNEIKFTTEHINISFSNYSSWHYRSTLRNLDSENVESELDLVQNAIFTDPNDSSPWFYLRWILSCPDLASDKKRTFCESLKQLLELDPDCKWIYMGICWLNEDLDETDSSVGHYEKLKELDELRMGRYEDLIKNTHS